MSIDGSEMAVQEAELLIMIDQINLPEASVRDGSLGWMVGTRQLQASILATFTQFLANNMDLLPPKESVLDWLSKAIDAAFTASKKPLLTAMLKPAVKTLILKAAGQLYDSLLTPAVEV